MGLEGRRELIEELEDNTEKFVRALGLEAMGRLMRKTPVDTGRARANWNASVGSPKREVDEDLRASDVRSQQQSAEQEIAEFGPGESLYLTNALPYIPPLEDGHSDQAPQGMIKVTAEELKPLKSRIVAQIARGQEPDGVQ